MGRRAGGGNSMCEGSESRGGRHLGDRRRMAVWGGEWCWRCWGWDQAGRSLLCQEESSDGLGDLVQDHVLTGLCSVDGGADHHAWGEPAEVPEAARTAETRLWRGLGWRYLSHGLHR